MKLIGSNTSPYVRKVRIVMAEKKIDYKYELENVWAAESTIQQFNPLGKVPWLIMEDGGAVFDSRVIVEYLDTLTPVTKLIPPSGRERVEVRCWESLADGVCDAAIAIRLEGQRPPEKQDDATTQRQMRKITAGLAAISTGLADKPFCSGQAYSLSDVAVGTALGYLELRFPKINWRADYANLAKLYDKLIKRPSFIETIPPA
jgi:glutathione S-transferase